MVSQLSTTAAPSRRSRRPASVARFTTPLLRNFNDRGYRTIVIEKLSVFLTEADAARLADFTDGALLDADAQVAVLSALRGAVRVADPADVPSNVVTIGSTVRVHDRQSRKVETLHLVFPGDHLDSTNRLVVLTPAGLALLGARVGDLVTWDASTGSRTAQVESVTHAGQTASATGA